MNRLSPPTTSLLASIRPALPIIIGAAVMLSFAMGLRQSLGVFMPELTRDIHISVSDFTLAIAVQNLAWGMLQPFAGLLAVKWGYRKLALSGAVLYAVGLAVLALASGVSAVIIGAGIAIGMALACTGPAIAMAAAAHAVPAHVRSTTLGIVSAAGSIGAMIAAPIGQTLMMAGNWRWGVAGFVVMALIMLPAAWFAGKVDEIQSPATPGTTDNQSASAALSTAMQNVPFVIMSLAYFVCGMQLVFLTTHLPAYLQLCGMDPMLSAKALGAIGAFNILGSLFFGWAGGRWNKLLLLGMIYTLRSLVLAWYFWSPPSVEGTLVFASMMGFLWLGVGPLVAGWIVDTFGLRWQAMLGGVAFVSHQLGSFLGAFGGGMLYDAVGNYNAAWQVGVAVGLVAGTLQIAAALQRPPPKPPTAPQPAFA